MGQATILRPLVEAGKRVVLYGAGKHGARVCRELREWAGIDVDCFCDGDVDKQSTQYCGKKVISPTRLCRDYADDIVLLTSFKSENIEQMRQLLREKDFRGTVFTLPELEASDVEVCRAHCASAHDGDTSFFPAAEQPERLAVFWRDGHTGGGISPFYEMFSQLNLTSVVELACGHGAHVPMYVDKCGQVTLVDILDKNIDFCRERFKDCPNVSYYRNNGYDLREIADNSCTALFTYDSMVHFEMFDVFTYLQETRRILVDGGKALFHHSNFNDPASYFGTTSHARAFMTKELFFYLVAHAGLKVVEQRVIDWGVKDLDCITLVQKGN